MKLRLVAPPWMPVLAVVFAVLSAAGGAAAAPFAYVPNEGSGTLSVIDVATDRVVAPAPSPCGSRARTPSMRCSRLTASWCS